jgi:hypothetical protein
MSKEQIVQQPSTVDRQTQFSDLPALDTERSTFDMSHPYKTTFDAGQLVPFLLMEVLPGDSLDVNATLFTRMATPIHPLMDSLSQDIHYFFVRNGIIWDNWKYFLGERRLPDHPNPEDYTIPQVTLDLSQIEGNLADYFGLPITDTTKVVEVNALPFRAYRLIWNEWYRNQVFQDWQEFPYDETVEDLTDLILYPRNKRRDYFTSANPWPQAGDPVYLPLGVSAPVVPEGSGAPTFNVGGTTNNRQGWAPGGDAQGVDWENPPSGGGFEVAVWNQSRLEADLTTATAATVNDIRTAFQVQKLLEKDARGGTREIEILLNHFSVQSADGRLGLPEFLGSGTGRITISPVANTVGTAEAAQGDLAAVGTGLVTGGFQHNFTEHGWLIGLTSVRSNLTYQNGIDRFWSRQTRYDMFWPSLQHLGEQGILQKEIHISGASSDQADNSVWGYIPRFDEYRYKQGRVTSRMRSNSSAPLDSWHLALDFELAPQLGPSFQWEAPPIDRVVAVPSEPDFIMDGWIDISATRVMPVYAVPGLIDHF